MLHGRLSASLAIASILLAAGCGLILGIDELPLPDGVSPDSSTNEDSSSPAPNDGSSSPADGDAGDAGKSWAGYGEGGFPGVFVGADPLTKPGCAMPCHVVSGVVAQWKASGHAQPAVIQPGVCGNCHALDGLERRVAGQYVAPPDASAPSNVREGHLNFRDVNGSVIQIGYAGTAATGRIHCSSCHEFQLTNDPHVTEVAYTGPTKLRVGGTVDDFVFVEKTPPGTIPFNPVGQLVRYESANVCIACHKSYVDVSMYIPGPSVLGTIDWGPHQAPQADLSSSRGAYEFTSKTYTSSTHATLPKSCVQCHMPQDPDGGVRDHSMVPNIERSCKTCHTTYAGTTFDILGGQTQVKNALAELQALLNSANMLTRAKVAPFTALGSSELADLKFHLDLVRPGSGDGGADLVVDGPTAGALYNYLLIARGRDLGVHNPTYTKQLLWDSIMHMKGGGTPASLPSRPL